MNHFSNKKFNLIKFGKSAIAVSSLALPALITTTANAVIRTVPKISTFSIRLGSGASSSSSVRNINTLKTSTSSAGIGNPTTPRANLSGNAYKKMASINTGGSSSIITNRINALYSSSTSTTSTTSNTASLPIPKGNVTNIKDRLNGTFHANLSSGFSNNTSPTGNVARLARNFTSSSTSTASSPSSSGKTSAPSGNVARLARNFTSSTTSTTSPSSSGKSSSPSGKVNAFAQKFSSSSTSTTSSSGYGKTSSPSGTGNVARIAKMFGN